LDHAQLGQIHDTERHVGMVEAQEFLCDGQSPRQQELRLGMLAGHAMENPQVIERGGDIGVKFALHSLVNLHRLQIHRFRPTYFPLPA
jgi:hypothetical protein